MASNHHHSIGMTPSYPLESINPHILTDPTSTMSQSNLSLSEVYDMYGITDATNPNEFGTIDDEYDSSDGEEAPPTPLRALSPATPPATPSPMTQPHIGGDIYLGRTFFNLEEAKDIVLADSARQKASVYLLKAKHDRRIYICKSQHLKSSEICSYKVNITYHAQSNLYRVWRCNRVHSCLPGDESRASFSDWKHVNNLINQYCVINDKTTAKDLHEAVYKHSGLDIHRTTTELSTG
ncbi:uncharacterized protein I206_103863 [Kwoniella pini CBS 10737]|uniref:Uncharacterized protein n=1 Tax=Kwoniella pini CBS 10737 TaxID=1296096 RepID=A0AAJ8MQ99_9TREE